VIGPVTPVPLSWGSPVGKRSLRLEGSVEKIGFEPAVKQWRSDGWRERRWWERWVDKWMRRWIQTGLVRLTEWIWKLIRGTGWCISEWAICDFQWGGGWWARKSKQMRRLNGDQVVKIARPSGCNNFVTEREKFIFDALVRWRQTASNQLCELATSGTQWLMYDKQ